jgi:sec-independent protein translocase protein TatB
MEIFGVGIGELVFIFLIAIIILGPNGMVKTASTLGKGIRKIIHSPLWASLMDTQRELREVPTRIVREAGLDEDLKELRKTSQEIRNFRMDEATLDKMTAPKKSEPAAAKKENEAKPQVEKSESAATEPAVDNATDNQEAQTSMSEARPAVLEPVSAVEEAPAEQVAQDDVAAEQAAPAEAATPEKTSAAD